jgi:glycosyltransferase involved in cell wall biosynthesis
VSARPDDALLREPVWLDLTRTLSRVGRGAPTGIDRVELAWADHLISANPNARFLCRTTRGFLLLSPEGGRLLMALMRGEATLGRADLWSRLTGRGGWPRHRAEAVVRDHAVDRCSRWALAAMIRRHGPSVYVNTGHSNLCTAVLASFAQAGVDIVAVVHDLIPITHPDLVPPEQPATFRAKIDAVADHATLAIAVSEDTRAALERLWAPRARHPEVAAVRIGAPHIPAPETMPAREPGRFLMVGTLEPRKNQVTMLAVWSRLMEDGGPDPLPTLHIVGNPGWNGERVRRSIESHPAFGKAIFLHPGCGDETLADQMRRADALLYPSLAEGFGLPPWEALSHGALPICSDLPVLRELLGAHAVYVDPADVYSWAETIRQRIAGRIPGPDGLPGNWPGWQDHFDGVSAALAALGSGRRAGNEGG